MKYKYYKNASEFAKHISEIFSRYEETNKYDGNCKEDIIECLNQLIKHVDETFPSSKDIAEQLADEIEKNSKNSNYQRDVKRYVTHPDAYILDQIDEKIDYDFKDSIKYNPFAYYKNEDKKPVLTLVEDTTDLYKSETILEETLRNKKAAEIENEARRKREEALESYIKIPNIDHMKNDFFSLKNLEEDEEVSNLVNLSIDTK
jgi:hypothetical protein